MCFIYRLLYRPTNLTDSVELLKGDDYKTKKYCTDYTYAVRGALSQASAIVELTSQRKFENEPQPALLTVNFTECPLGFERGVSIHWTGTLDWNGGMEYWNDQGNKLNYKISFRRLGGIDRGEQTVIEDLSRRHESLWYALGVSKVQFSYKLSISPGFA